ncbi:hypothetical protein H7I40_05610 [Mycolicibacterium madagascariense]|nr:hypothetical protein [Mycolicibacterium madagascariense]
MLIAATVIVTVFAVAAVVWAIFGGRSNSQRPAENCVTVAMASSMGGGVEHACGRAAHDWCQAAYAHGDVHARAVQVQCRRAGIAPES